MQTFREKTSLRVTVRLRPTAGTTLEYLLRNLTEDVTEVDWTAVTPLETAVIDLSAENIRIADDRNRREVYELTVVSDRNTAQAVPFSKQFYVQNQNAYT